MDKRRKAVTMSCVKSRTRSSEICEENKSNKINTRSKTKAIEDKEKQNPNNNLNKKPNKLYFKHNRKRNQPLTGNKGHKRRRVDYSRRFIPPTKFLLGGNIHDPLNLNSLQDEEINRAMNAITPKSSPLPTPQHKKGEIEVIIPPNICDPLNLAQCDDENSTDYTANLMISPLKKMKRPRKKRKRSGCTTDEVEFTEGIKLEEKSGTVGSSDLPMTSVIVRTASSSEASFSIPMMEPAIPCEGARTPELVMTSSAAQEALDKPLQPLSNKKVSKKDSSNALEIKINKRLLDSKDKIVSPVVPQPTHGISHSRYRQLTPQISKGQQTPRFKEKNCRFQYGNYNKYYGYRNPNHEIDPRIKVLDKYRHVFHGSDVLDIGCNIGHITLTVARDFGAKSVVGIDIDKHLINVARTNVKHYVKCKTSPFDNMNEESHSVGMSKRIYASFSDSQIKEPIGIFEQKDKTAEDKTKDHSQENSDVFFPISMPILYGGTNIPGIPSKHSNMFPHNVSFVQGNYVLESDILLNVEQAQFDVILCLSVTKWFHLNWGDAGLKRVFKRMYAQLRPGGVLILEPQSWTSYKRKTNLTEAIWRNYQSIEFFPHHFTQYLLSEVGFTKCETLGSPVHHSKGFQRPVKMFTKGEIKDTKLKEVNPSGEWT